MAPATPTFVATLRRWWWPEDVERRAALRWWLIALGLAFGVCLCLTLATADAWPELAARVAAKGKKPKVQDIALGLFWKALVVNTGLLGLLLLSLPVWARPQKMTPAAPASPSFWRSQGWIILIMVLLAAACRVPRMNMSLYNDEAHNYARLFSGVWKKQSPDAEPVFDAATWSETVWRNTGGNNAQPFTILARVSLDGARAMGFAVPGEVCEWAVRLPSLIAGLLSLVLAGWLAWRWLGRPGLIVTLAMLALHPWHVRYSTEARGQALLFFGVVLGFCFLTLALERGSWRCWLGYGFSLFICASSFLGCVYFLAAWNGLLLGRQFWLWKKGHHGADQIVRPIVAGLLAAMLGLQLILPIIPGLLEIMKNSPTARGPMPLAWWEDIHGSAMAASRWHDLDPSNPASLALTRWMPGLWGQSWRLLWLATVAFGSITLWRRGGAARLLAIAAPTGAFCSWLLASLQGNYLQLWYLYFSLPWIVLAFGACWVARYRWLSLLALCFILGPMLRVTLALQTQTKQDMRWAVEVSRGAAYPDYLDTQGAKPLTAGFWTNSDLYDPHMTILSQPEELEALITKAKTEQRDLFVTYSHRPNAQVLSPGLLDITEDKAVFDHMGTRNGLEEAQFAQSVYKLRR